MRAELEGTLAAGVTDRREGWRAVLWPGTEVRLELRVRSLRRLRTVAMLAAVVHVGHLVVFALGQPFSSTERTWRIGILASHAVLLAVAATVRVVVGLALRDPTGALARTMPWAVFGTWLTAGAVITAIDQLVTPSIVAFLAGNLVVGTVLILPPARAVWGYLGALAGFAWAMAQVAADANTVLSNQVNGVTAVALGFALTSLQWRSEVRDVDKSLRIEAQQRELEARNVELHHLASHDPLTGLVNRRQFASLAAQELAHARRHGRPVSLLEIDVDHFKRVNDTYGHLVGDELLRELVTRLGGRLRDTDVLARWGGEEFVALLPGTDVAGAAAVAEQLREAAAGCPLGSDGEVAVTVSIGVAAVDPFAATPIEDAYRVADAAMYAAKAAGRDRVRIGGDPAAGAPSPDPEAAGHLVARNRSSSIS